MSGTLEIRNLTKDFKVRDGFKRGTLRAANEINFVHEQGKTIALVGESGSGKSTVARMIAKLERPTSGQILLDGKRPSAVGASPVIGTKCRCLPRSICIA